MVKLKHSTAEPPPFCPVVKAVFIPGIKELLQLQKLYLCHGNLKKSWLLPALYTGILAYLLVTWYDIF